MPKGISGNISGRNEKHLTVKQAKFAKEYVYNDGSKTQTECALDAGYADTSAAVRASELTNPQKYPLVVRYIQGLQAELARIRDQAIDKGNLTAAVSAEVQRGRAAGLYIERKEVRTGTLDSLSEVEIKNRIKKLLGDFKPLLEVEDAVIIEGE